MSLQCTTQHFLNSNKISLINHVHWSACTVCCRLLLSRSICQWNILKWARSDAICHLFKKLERLFGSVEIYKKNNGPVLLFKTIYQLTASCRLLSVCVVTDKKDESELKLGKVWSSFNAMPAENVIVVIVPWWNLFDIFIKTLQEHFVHG